MGRFLKFFKDVDGVDIYPAIALTMFMVFFVAVTYWAIKAKRSDMENAAQLPLDDNSPS